MAAQVLSLTLPEHNDSVALCERARGEGQAPDILVDFRRGERGDEARARLADGQDEVKVQVEHEELWVRPTKVLGSYAPPHAAVVVVRGLPEPLWRAGAGAVLLEAYGYGAALHQESAGITPVGAWALRGMLVLHVEAPPGDMSLRRLPRRLRLGAVVVTMTVRPARDQPAAPAPAAHVSH